MKTKFKVIIAVILAVVISIGSISAYKYITSPKEESIPLETTQEDAAELTTQKMIISDVFRSTKGTIPHCTIDEDSIKIKSSDLKIYDTNFAIMSVDKETVMELVGEAEKKAKKNKTKRGTTSLTIGLGPTRLISPLNTLIS